MTKKNKSKIDFRRQDASKKKLQEGKVCSSGSVRKVAREHKLPGDWACSSGGRGHRPETGARETKHGCVDRYNTDIL